MCVCVGVGGGGQPVRPGCDSLKHTSTSKYNTLLNLSIFWEGGECPSDLKATLKYKFMVPRCVCGEGGFHIKH